MAGVEFDCATAKKRLAEFFFVDDERRRIVAEVTGDESPRGRARDDRTAAIVSESISVRAGALRNREQVRERVDDVIRDIHIDEVNVDHSRHPNAATPIVTA